MTDEIHKREKHIDSLFEKTKKLSKLDELDIEIISEFTKYLCVLVSGHLEKSIYLCLIKYSHNRATPGVTKFMDIQLKKFTNAKMGKIEGLLESFNKDWKIEFMNLNNYSKLKDSINSLVVDRHAIAHGNTMSLSISRLQGYYKDTKEVIKEIRNIVK